MRADENGKKYEAVKIPRPGADPQPRAAPRPKPEGRSASADGPVFYEIDYSASPIEGVGRFVRRTQKIETPARDPIRERFLEMREISRRERTPFYRDSWNGHPIVRQEAARVFYLQARFMEDFEDDCAKETPFSSYYPSYQMMGYDQLRTYFTWRTAVRRGDVRETSLSYAFLYLYELLHTVGAADPSDALGKLTDFWESYRQFDSTVDRYVLRWLADYHIYYTLPHTFEEFLLAHRLTAAYADIAKPRTGFAFYERLSNYSVGRSAFCTAQTRPLIENAVMASITAAREALSAAGTDPDSLLFCASKKAPHWTPFHSALFYPWLKQPDRTVVLSGDDVYLCRDNAWTHSAAVATLRGKKLIGYILKQTEATLREITRYRFRLNADLKTLDPETRELLGRAGIRLDETVRQAVLAYYREATRTVVTVNDAALSRIREDAAATQAALTVEENSPAPASAVPPAGAEAEEPETRGPMPDPPAQDAHQTAAAAPMGPAPEKDGWDALWERLSETEKRALAALVSGGTLERFAAENGVLPELLAESVNEKALDTVGDGLLDEALSLYPDYTEQITERMR